MNMERRILTGSTVELRAAGDKGPALVGYAAVFNSRSLDLGGFQEIIAPGAFEKVVADADEDMRALFNHDRHRVLGRRSAGTLRLREDDDGLHDEIDLPDTTLGRDLAESVGRRDITGQSFSFIVAEDGDEFADVDGVLIRTIRRFERLFDVGPVTFPAYEGTTVDARAIDHAKQFAKKHRHKITDTQFEREYRKRWPFDRRSAGV